MDSAGAVAAPLLAGFCFTLLVLLLPAIDNTSITHTPTGTETTRPEPFSGAAEVAAVLLLTAGVFLIGSVQAAITMRKHAMTPNELEEWYPHYFRESEESGGDDDDQRDEAGLPKAKPSFWSTDDGWSYRRVGRRWYGAQIRRYLYTELLEADRWAKWARRLYHIGIVALLSGLTALVWPPAGEWSLWRTVLLAVAAVATGIECIWITRASWSRGDVWEGLTKIRRVSARAWQLASKPVGSALRFGHRLDARVWRIVRQPPPSSDDAVRHALDSEDGKIPPASENDESDRPSAGSLAS